MIVATQVLESMISPAPDPRRGLDCANAVLTARRGHTLGDPVGEFPIIAVETMARIIENTEQPGAERIARPPDPAHPWWRSRAAAEVGEISA